MFADGDPIFVNQPAMADALIANACSLGINVDEFNVAIIITTENGKVITHGIFGGP